MLKRNQLIRTSHSLKELHKYALRKNVHVSMNDELIHNYDVRIVLSSAKAKSKGAHIYFFNPLFVGYKSVILMPIENRLYIEPTNTEHENAYALRNERKNCILPRAHISGRNCDRLKRFEGLHMLNSECYEDGLVYYIEI